MEGRIEIVIEKVFKIFKIEKSVQNNCTVLWSDYNKSNWFMCPVFLVAYDPTHDMPYSFV